MRKVRVISYLKPETFRALRTMAQTHGLSVGRFAAHKLQHAVEEGQDDLAVTLFLPAVEAAIRREVARAANRLANLLARTALEVSTVRRLLYHELLHSGMDRAQARSLHDQLWYLSVQRLKQPLAEVEEILAALPPQEQQSLASVLNAAPAERRDGTSA